MVKRRISNRLKSKSKSKLPSKKTVTKKQKLKKRRWKTTGTDSEVDELPPPRE